MNGYVKLFGSILASTIWNESSETRVCWITMLAMADRFGIVQASIPGLATIARLDVHEVEDALRRLHEPDPYSRTKDNEGRRIETVEGGWLILNHEKYRQKMSEDDRREYLKKAQRRSRERKRQHDVNNVNSGVDPSTMSTQADTKADSKAKAESQSGIDSLNQELCDSQKRNSYSPDFQRFWEAYPAVRKQSKGTAYKAWGVALHEGADPEVIIQAAGEYAASPVGSGTFSKMPQTWLNGRCWEDDRGSWQQQPEANGRRLRFGPGQVSARESPKGIGEM